MRGGPSISVSSTVAGGEEHGSPTRAVTFVDERYGSEGLATIRWMGECGNPPDCRRLDHSASPTRARLTRHRATFANPDGLATPARPPRRSRPRSPRAGMARHHVGPPPPSGKRPGHRSRIGSSRSSSSIPARPSTPYFRLMSESGRGQACSNRQPLPQRRRLPPQSARVALASSAGQMRDDRRLCLASRSNTTGGSDQAFCS
jgi:hypothetical protein